MYALGHTEVFFSPILPHDEEASCLIILGVRPHFEVAEVLHLCLCLVVQFEQIAYELGIVALQLVPVFFQIQYGSRFALYFVDVQVVHACDLVGCLGALDTFALLLVLGLGLLFGSPDFGRDAELVVTALLGPELFQFLAVYLPKCELLFLDLDFVFDQLVDEVSLDS